jgi:hypothetical protein
MKPKRQNDRVKRMIVAIDILKAVVSRDRWAMIACESKYGRPAIDPLKLINTDTISKNLCELALDVLCGEQPLP